MGNPYVNNAATFLISTGFGLYILIVMLRFLFQLVRANFYNPVCQFIVAATNPPLRQLRRLIPGYAGIDLSTIVLMLALKIAELWLTAWIRGGSPNVAGLVVFGIAELIRLAITIFIISILIEVVLSWVSPGAQHPVLGIIHSLNEPLLGRARRLIPSIGGMDISPIAVFIGLQLISKLLVDPLSDAGAKLL